MGGIVLAGEIDEYGLRIPQGQIAVDENRYLAQRIDLAEGRRFVLTARVIVDRDGLILLADDRENEANLVAAA